MAFHFEPLDIPDVIAVRPDRYGDDRGFFSEVYRREPFVAAGIPDDFVQDNLTHSRHGVLRGLHYQLPPAPQGKLVGVVQGRIFDVAVDLRRGSGSYGRWVARTLDGASGELLWIPRGFAHGYCVLSETADVLYKVSAGYVEALDRGLCWDDPTVAIDWPIDSPVLSEKDRNQPDLGHCDNPFVADGEPDR